MRCIVAWVLVGLMLHACVGCASLPEERRSQEIAAVSIVVVAAGGILLARSIAHSGRSQVVSEPRRVLGPP